MRGTLRIFRTPSFSIRALQEFTGQFLPGFQEIHFLLTDGIMLNFREIFPEDILPGIRVQRILTSYQLQKILMESDSNPHYIAAASAVLASWPPKVIEGIYDVMKIKSYYNGGIIFMNVVGSGGIFEKYLGNMAIPGGSARNRGGLYSWEEQFRQ